MSEFSGPLTITLQKDELICIAGDQEVDLYRVRSGKLMVFVNDGTKITPLSYLGKDEYLGELSFFDKEPRSAHVVALEKTELIKIPVTELEEQAPRWLITMATHVAKKIRKADELIRKKGIRRQNVESIKPLSIDEQRHFFQLIKDRVS